MDLPTLLDALSSPAAWPHPVDRVEVKQTHLSAVFLAGAVVYKIKKPLNLGFVDFSTLARRRYFCEQEVALNRRLAADVYLGVVPVTRGPAGLRFEGEGDAIEWAVKMRRLPDEATLEARLAAGQVTPGWLRPLAQRIAAFHREAPSAPQAFLAEAADVVARNARENFTQARSLVGVAVAANVFDRLRDLTEEHLTRLGPLIRRRAENGLVRDTHGDLRLDHVYLFPDEAPPGDLVILDCVEFNERFRYADPVADVAFLVMDLYVHGRPDLAQDLTRYYFAASGDIEGATLLPFYAAYRAVVRGKVEGMKQCETEVPAGERAAALRRARRHWLLALVLLEVPERVPCLVLIGGLPGSGKSTLSRALAADGYELLRSDVVRQELYPQAEGRYHSEATQQTYAECLRRAERLLDEGRRVIVDATFRREAHRRLFLDAAPGGPALMLVCQAEPAVIQERLTRRRGDVSEADWSVYLEHERDWEPLGPATARLGHVIRTDGTASAALAQARTLIATAMARFAPVLVFP